MMKPKPVFSLKLLTVPARREAGGEGTLPPGAAGCNPAVDIRAGAAPGSMHGCVVAAGAATGSISSAVLVTVVVERRA